MNLEGKSTKELEDILSGKAPLPEDAPAKETPVETAKAEPAERTEGEEKIAAEGGESESKTEPEAEPDQDKKPNGKTEESEMSRGELVQAILQAQLDEALALANRNESIARKERSITGRTTGEVGYLRQRVAELEARLNERPAEPDGEYLEDERPAPRREPRREPTIQPDNGVAEWARSRAISDAGVKFRAAHSDLSEHAEHMARYMKETGLDTENMTPLEAEREVTRLLNEAYWDSRALRSRERTAEFRKREATQFNGQKEAKRNATMSGGGAPPAPAPKEKPLSEMSTAELRSKLDSFGPDPRAGRRPW